MSILAKFRKIIFISSFFRTICKRLLLQAVNQVQYILGSRVVQQASTISVVNLGLEDWFIKRLWSNIYKMDRAQIEGLKGGL